MEKEAETERKKAIIGLLKLVFCVIIILTIVFLFYIEKSVTYNVVECMISPPP